MTVKPIPDTCIAPFRSLLVSNSGLQEVIRGRTGSGISQSSQTRGKLEYAASFLKILLEWRIEAHKDKNQFQLNEQFNSVVERFKTPVATVSGKRGQRNKSRRSKKAATDSGSPSTNLVDGTTASPGPGNDDASDGTGKVMVTRK